ncbi:MAG: hypothetical protein AABW79_01275 [Nanoarchaeota archaeon]
MKTSPFSKRIRYQQEKKRIQDRIKKGIDEGKCRYNWKHPNPVSALEEKIDSFVNALVDKPHIKFSENSITGNLIILSSSLAGLVYGTIEGYNLYEERPYSGALVGAGLGPVVGMGASFLILKGIDYVNNKIDEYKVKIHNEKKQERIRPLRDTYITGT